MTHWGRKKEGAEIVNAGFTGICLSPCREWGLRMARRLGDALLIVGLVAPAAPAGGYATDWAKAAKSEARLVAADGRARRLRDRARARRHHLLARSRRCGRAAEPSISPARRMSRGSSRSSRRPSGSSEADGSEAFGYDGSVRLPLAGRAARSVETGHARAARQLRRLRKTLPAGRGAPDAGAARGGRRLALCGPRRDGAGRRPARCGGEGFRRAQVRRRRTAGGSAPRTSPAPRATSSSNRRPAGG